APARPGGPRAARRNCCWPAPTARCTRPRHRAATGWWRCWGPERPAARNSVLAHPQVAGEARRALRGHAVVTVSDHAAGRWRMQAVGIAQAAAEREPPAALVLHQQRADHACVLALAGAVADHARLGVAALLVLEQGLAAAGAVRRQRVLQHQP